MAQLNPTTDLKPGCAVLVSAAFFVAGSFFLWLMTWNLVIPELRAKMFFVENTCVILDKRVEESNGEGGPNFHVEFLIKYSVDDQQYETWTYDAARVGRGLRGKERILEKFQVGQQCPCWYDSNNPGSAVLVRTISWFHYLFLLIPLLFVMVGAFGVRYYWVRRGKSPESLAVLDSGGRRTCAKGFQVQQFPSVPALNFTHRPGKRLKFRLALGTWQNWWVVAAILVFAVFWNGFAWLFAAIAIYSHVIGQPDYCLTFFMIPFVAFGFLLLGAFVRTAILTALCLPAMVEIGAHPLQPGQRTALYAAQRGPLRVRDLKLAVVCEEISPHPERKNARTDTHRIHHTDLGATANAWDWQGEFQIPQQAMHSFKALHNEIQWKVVVQGKAAGLFKILWEYPFVVLPSPKPRTFQ